MLKRAEAKGEFALADITAHKVETATKQFYDYIGTLKTEVLTVLSRQRLKVALRRMDKGDNIDSWFL
jgi:hypothetical protein